jgi:RNA polymerase sigma factor (sigma-70 family)
MAAESIENQFLEQINRNIGIVHKVAKAYCLDPVDREDIFQEIIFQLWRSYPSFNHQSKFSTWMYQVALNTAITYFKKENRNIQKEELTERYLNVAQEQTMGEEKIESLYVAINTLSPIDKMIVLLYLEENTYEEIALITGLTKTNVSVKLVRIKKELETKLKNKK